MFSPTFDPLGSIWLSALVAAIPIVLFLLGLTVLKLKGIHAALMTLIATTILSIFPFSLPFGAVFGAIAQGFWAGFWPIGYIIIMAMWLYRLTVATGKIDVIKGSLTMMSADQRIQLLLIGFCFGGFLEGAAGFGVPIAICSVMLAALGFNPLQAAMLCLISNAATGAWGAIGIPVAIVDTFKLDSVTALGVSRATNTTLPIVAFTVPFLIVWILDGVKGIKETLPAILVTSIVFTLSQMVVSYFLGPELVDIVPPLVTLVAVAVLCTKWKPKNIFRLVAEDESSKVNYTTKQIIDAWMPFILLSVAVIVWSMPFFKVLFAKDGALAFTTFGFDVYADGAKKIGVSLDLIKATGTAILVAVLITIFTNTQSITPAKAFGILKETCKSFWIAVVTISCILAIAKLMTYTGMTKVLGEAIAETGSVFPLLSPVLGWIGVFMTGSVVNNNTLFAGVQSTVANKLSIDPNLLVSANTAGGTMAKLVSPQSIAIATGALGQAGQESAVLKMVLKYSISLLVFVCVWTFILTMF
ncbi:L-lactate permease [Kingella negevensis]|uniref:L-lactate permease n=1 Tax=Kingella negevensis TaxID=1522312 RepID=A0A238HET9_9NEIS|nr:L-lactate permease [Kingella negevensis]MDK4684303.1 L-lactate permease [Kingella negevensis]MDK4688151.1 L-lactate permease [Kingella negevensis]MDK4697569.1 L-lactate permease [Kingella negevensis]MDK4706925.1 L-lactate permease [Kingella negevensis]MDK4710505.1 L-lactate permease [Kingella negevensis]